MIPEIVRGLIVGAKDDREKAERIRDYVATAIRHDYHFQPTYHEGTLILDPEKLIELGYGRCGQRAAVFQALANGAGLVSNIVFYRGHICNLVYIDGKWEDFDTTESRHEFESELIEYVKSTPIIGRTRTPNYLQDPDFSLFYDPLDTNVAYVHWLNTLKFGKKVNFILPRDLLEGKSLITLATDKPNVIIRHDICSMPDYRVVMAMLHEENQYNIRSVTYVRVDNIAYDIDHYAPMFKMFEDEGFEIGLHITAANQHGLTEEQAFARLNVQENTFMKYFKSPFTVQAHGFDDELGVPKVTNYDLERERLYGFENLVKSHWRIADSLGVMQPKGDVEDSIKRMKNGRLYYCLWHPEYYYTGKNKFREKWVAYEGMFAESYSEGRLLSVLPRIRRRFNDTAYFDTIPSHLQRISQYLAAEINRGDVVLDLACGWGLLNILIRRKRSLFLMLFKKSLINHKSFEYIGVDHSYSRMKAGQVLHMAVGVDIPKLCVGDISKPEGLGLTANGDWVVFVGWEGDARREDVDTIPRYVKDGGHLVMSYIDKDDYTNGSWQDKLPSTANPYVLMSKTEVSEWAARNGLVMEGLVDKRDVFPRRLAVFKKEV